MTGSYYGVQRSNGLAVAALVVGIVAISFALIPFTFVVAMILGLVGTGLGIPAVLGAYRGADRRVMAWFGLCLSVLALVVGISWIAALTQAADDLNVDLQPVERTYYGP